MKHYSRLIKLVVPHMGVFIMAVMCMIVTSLLSASPGPLIMLLIDRVLTGNIIQTPEILIKYPQIVNFINQINAFPPLKLLQIMTILMVLMFFLKGIFEFLQTYFMNDVSQRVIRDVKNTIYKKLQELSMSFYAKNPTGGLMSRITYDAAVIRDAISSGFADTIFEPIQLVSYVLVILGTILFGMPIQLILYSLILFPVIIFPVIKIGKRLRKISKSSQEKIGDINNMLLETITGAKLVKSFCMEDYEWNRFREHNQSFYRLNMKAIKRMKIVSPMTESMGIICGAVILWIVGQKIVDGTLSAGVFGTFLFAVFSMMKPAKKLSNVYGINQQALAAAERIFELIDEPVTIENKQNPVELKEFKDKIIFKNVNFKYDDELILKNINLEIKKGEVIALVGPSGAGKSTLVNLIPRFYDTNSGEILIDNNNVKDLNIRSLREKIGVVSQETLLFNDSVKANISYGHDEIDEDQLVKVAKAANAHRFIKDFPEGYNTEIGERGLKVSGGQRQRIAIARSIYKNPPILIFDEATSQLDTESEKLVQEAINNLMKGRTVIVIAHRLSTIQHADKILVMENGEIVSSGTHSELLENSPLYNKLYQMQFNTSPKM